MNLTVSFLVFKLFRKSENKPGYERGYDDAYGKIGSARPARSKAGSD